jgi:AraC family cel operon transcriptional repressor
MMTTLTLADIPEDIYCTYAHGDYVNESPADPHRHDFHEFFWVEEGDGIHWINAQSYPLKVGELILIRASDEHTFSAARKGGRLRIVNFAFFASLWTYVRQRYFDSRKIFFSEPDLPLRSYQLDRFQLTAVRNATSALRSGRRDRLPVEVFLLNVLEILGRMHVQPGATLVPDWIRTACSAISTNRNFASGVPQLAKLAGRSQEHLAREFRRYLNRTPTDFINDARMSYAAEKLATSSDSILSITYDCGLENLGHFYRLFHARFGCTPRAYRLSQRQTLDTYS